MIKKFLKYILYGIAWGWGFLVIFCVIIDVLKIEPLRTVAFDNFSKNALASAVTGIGFGASSIVYTFDRLRRRYQTLIHFGIGMGIYLPVAFYMNWIPSASPSLVISGIIMAVAYFFLVWSGFYLYDKFEAKKINKRLTEQEKLH